MSDQPEKVQNEEPSTDVESVEAFQELDESLDTILVPMTYGLVQEAPSLRVVRSYAGQTLAAMMRDVVKAPKGAQFFVDKQSVPADFVIPEDFSPAGIVAVKQTGQKG